MSDAKSKPANPRPKPTTVTVKTAKSKPPRTPADVVAGAAMTVIWFLIIQKMLTNLSPYLTMAMISLLIAGIGTFWVAWRGSYWEPPFPQHHKPGPPPP